MFGWIKKRCRRRSLPPSIRQLQEEETNRPRAAENIYFTFEEQDDHVYEEVCTDSFISDNQDYASSDCSERTYDSGESHYDVAHSNVGDDKCCPLCRSVLVSSLPCECTNVYEVPCISTRSTESASSPDDENPYETPTTPTNIRPKVVGHSPDRTNRYTLAASLDVVYELATCPFKVPNPIKKRPVNRSVSDAGSRPLPRIPIHGRQRTVTETTETQYDDDSSGFYESIGSDCESTSDGNGYSNICSSTNELNSFSNDDLIYEEFDFQSEASPSAHGRRYSLGSATPTNTYRHFGKRDMTLSHDDHLNKVMCQERNRRHGALFRSFRVRSLFKPAQ